MKPTNLLSILGTICPGCAADDCAKHEPFPYYKVKQARDEDNLSAVLRTLPSGSGFDSAPSIEKLEPARVVFKVPFHPMNSVGFYLPWVNLRVTVRATFAGPEIRVTGGRDAELRDYVAEVYHEALTADCWASLTNGANGVTTIERVQA